MQQNFFFTANLSAMVNKSTNCINISAPDYIAKIPSGVNAFFSVNKLFF
jgi:hypothetical protein